MQFLWEISQIGAAAAPANVIIKKSRGEVSLVEQDTIENVS